MGKYGEAAIEATTCLRKSPGMSPADAWKEAVKLVFPNSASSQNKACPKGAFLGLCEEGIVRGVPPGRYTDAKENKGYAVAAYHVLTQEPRLATNKRELWERVTQYSGKRPNEQMDVVVAVWESDFLVK
jgi:hypothetical protein